MGKRFCQFSFFAYLCTVQWNEGLEKAPHFHISKSGLTLFSIGEQQEIG